MRLGLVETRCTDPYRNLAEERYLLETVEDDQVILYLWQNENTVVIGRNQSALAECRVQDLEGAGGKLARRLSGGGAVYHDLGNLNFTFVMPSALYDEEKQTRVVLRAVQMLGIQATRTGRNDLLAQGAKFSGHAYYHTKGKSYHHGTLLVQVDTQKMAAYLNPSPLKLASKGVASVKSRVCNLADFVEGLGVADVARAMASAFEEVYGGSAQRLELGEEAQERIEGYAREFASPEWLYRKERVLAHSREAKFDWGLVRVDWELAPGADDSQAAGRSQAAGAPRVEDGPQAAGSSQAAGDSQAAMPSPTLADVALYSDSLDADFLEGTAEALCGCPADAAALTETLEALARSLPASPFGDRARCIKDIVSLIA